MVERWRCGYYKFEIAELSLDTKAFEWAIKRGPQGDTAYVSQLCTVRNREVCTKYVFAGGTRLVSKMVKLPKDLDLDGIDDPLANDCSEPWGWTNGNGQGLGHANGNGPCANNGNGNGNGNGGGGAVYEKDQYFYHPDHLGSSSYVTDVDGEIFQHLEYFPFGETWVEESSNTQRTPYLFTGKELDEETGLYYFGARYYDPRTSVWQSPDPMLQNYLMGAPVGGVYLPANLNSFGYAHQRPIVANDPEGEWLNFVIAGIKATAENIVIQNAEMALGLRDEFSWGEMAFDGALGTVTSGLSTAKNAGRIAELGMAVSRRGDDAADIARQGTRRIDDAVDARRTPRQSEQLVESQTPDGRSQVSFKGRDEVPYGTKGSVRPDVCTGGCSIEVKNYNIANNRSGLVRNILGQVTQRADNLPVGMSQNIVIDVGGQNVSQSVRNEIMDALIQGSNGALGPSSIRFLD